MQKLIVFDLDRTAVEADDTASVPENTAQAIKARLADGANIL